MDTDTKKSSGQDLNVDAVSVSNDDPSAKLESTSAALQLHSPCSSAALSGERYKTVKSARASPTSPDMIPSHLPNVDSAGLYPALGPRASRSRDMFVMKLATARVRRCVPCVHGAYSARVYLFALSSVLFLACRRVRSVFVCGRSLLVPVCAPYPRSGRSPYQFFFVIKISMCSTAVPRSSSYVPIE
ncbi:hypothetical protein EVAR_94437_1 [Eumeta japonica]|uniref:Uncharacterized protein n=1 Tax=Eumeta variegata TaxID=151549 RepID=A0A4C1TQ57_EUMVA|nr:hypothetical protein EVAR_94437_1 [Eumeta japonica]